MILDFIVTVENSKMPIRWGKSLCYQIPSLILQGSTLVITQLITFMEDQVIGPSKLGIKAIYLELRFI